MRQTSLAQTIDLAEEKMKYDACAKKILSYRAIVAWICPSPAKKRKNGIFRYHTIEDVIVGQSYTEPEDYDMMEIIILNLGDGEKYTGYSMERLKEIEKNMRE